MDLEQLEERFQVLAADCALFSRDIAGIIVPGGKDRFRLAALNLEIARTVFGKWGIEILVVLYNLGDIGFEELRRGLGGISPRVLSRKLRTMQDQDLVKRTVIMDSRPPGVRYSLTETGITVARIGTPVFLFLSFRKQQGQDHSWRRIEPGLHTG